MRSKTAHYHQEILNSDYEIYGFIETNLSEDIFDSEIFTDKFDVFRNDRNKNNNLNDKSSGGGVLWAAHKSLGAKLLKLGGFDMLEYCCIKIRTLYKSIFLLTEYLPPASPTWLYEKHIELLEAIHRLAALEDEIFTFGDYNLPNLIWENQPELNCQYPSNIATPSEFTLIDGMSASGFSQVNPFNNNND